MKFELQYEWTPPQIFFCDITFYNNYVTMWREPIVSSVVLNSWNWNLTNFRNLVLNLKGIATVLQKKMLLEMHQYLQENIFQEFYRFRSFFFHFCLFSLINVGLPGQLHKAYAGTHSHFDQFWKFKLHFEHFPRNTRFISFDGPNNYLHLFKNHRQTHCLHYPTTRFSFDFNFFGHLIFSGFPKPLCTLLISFIVFNPILNHLNI